MDLSTTYMGLTLRSPLVPSASPLSREIGDIKRMEDAGAGAVVLYSLFEEEVLYEQRELQQALTAGSESFAESLTYFPEPHQLFIGPETYLDHIQKATDAVEIPIIASLNCSSLGSWTDYARKMEQAGADAIELNVYWIPTDADLPSDAVEQTYVDIVKAVASGVEIPVAVKLSPYFTNVANMAKRLSQAGADALVLFNRFYQPDIDLESLEVRPNVLLSTAQAMRLPMRWVAILYKTVEADLAATSGIHTAEDALKMLMAGANVTMMASALLHNGVGHLKTVEQNMVQWMEQHEYESIEELRGSMSQMNCDNPSAFERAQYMRALKTYKV
ncbi:MAG: dihydroorotate dehydrogenase-like protein [Candidatus Sumerlaeota bacterium]|nr:dihydroorotate dehydrogenase-like protein [Candidatus Sumerlaeota bacterium]